MAFYLNSIRALLAVTVELHLLLTWMRCGKGIVQCGQARRMRSAGMQGGRALIAKHSSARGCRTELQVEEENKQIYELQIPDTRYIYDGADADTNVATVIIAARVEPNNARYI